MLLNKTDLLEIEGGIKTITISSIIGGIVFLIGIISGYIKPISCSK